MQFARLGAVYAEDILGRSNPVDRAAQHRRRAGEGKRRGQGGARSCFRRPASTSIGNVEGRDLPAGASDRGPFDVVVCDGFVGNVVLKFYEAIAPFIVRLLASTRASMPST